MVSDAECSCEITSADREKHDLFLQLQLQVKPEESLRGYVRSLVPTLEDARKVMRETSSFPLRRNPIPLEITE